MNGRERRRLVPLVALLALALPLLSCESDTPSEPVVVITPEPVRGVLAQTSFSGFQTGVWVSIEILVSQKGVVDLTVDWTYPDTWMYVYWGQEPCAYSQLDTRTCPFLIASETKDPKPRVLVTGLLEPKAYYIYLYNVPRDPRLGIGSDNTESVALQVGQTIFPFTSGGEGIKLGRVQTLRPPRL
jgi:hypothetical protein